MADEEAQNQEQNAEATEAVEAGAEAAEAAPAEAPKPPSVLMPMLLSAVITVAGVGVMVAVVLPKQIESAIKAAKAQGAAHGEEQAGGEGAHGETSDGAHGDSHGGGGDSHGGDGDHGEETTAADAEADDPKKPVAIVPEGESIVVNPANSGGSRYLLVEIFLLREDEKDIGFTKAVEGKTKQLQAKTMDYLSAEDVQSLSNPATKQRLEIQLKLAYQQMLGESHPIKELIISKWIMQ